MTAFDMAAGLGAGVEQQQNDLRRAVDSGELWMEAGVAERAAQRCEQTIQEIDVWLGKTDLLVERLPFGNNDDGDRASTRFVLAGKDFVNEMKHAQRVLRNMADTYRAAGRTVVAADEAGRQSFQGGSE